MLHRPPAVTLREVQIIVDISEDENGRAVGTVRAADTTPGRFFSGNLELLALIENLYRISTEPSGPQCRTLDKEHRS